MGSSLGQSHPPISSTLALLWSIYTIISDKHFLSSFTHIQEVKVTQSCPTLCNPKVCSPPGSSVHGILQARILEWVAIPFFRGSSWPMDWTHISRIAGRFFTVWATKTKMDEINYLIAMGMWPPVPLAAKDWQC